MCKEVARKFKYRVKGPEGRTFQHMRLVGCLILNPKGVFSAIFGSQTFLFIRWLKYLLFNTCYIYFIPWCRERKEKLLCLKLFLHFFACVLILFHETRTRAPFPHVHSWLDLWAPHHALQERSEDTGWCGCWGVVGWLLLHYLFVYFFITKAIR